MKTVLLLLPVILQVAAGQRFSVEPQREYVVQDGESVTIECITSEPVQVCAWKVQLPELPSISGFLTSSQSTDLPEIVGKDPESKTDCSIVINSVSSRYNGRYTCSPFTNAGQEDSSPAEVVVAQKPVSVEFVGDQAGQREMTVTADEAVSITCEARDGRPRADLAWFLGEVELFDGVEASEEVDPGSKLVTTRSTLTHSFRKEDDRSQLRCEARHPGYDDLDLREVTIDIMVHYMPFRKEGDDLGTLYGYTTDQEGKVVVNFTANPPPSVVVWMIGETEQVGAGETSPDGRFSASPLEEMAPGQHQYSAQLMINPVKMEDQDVPFQLRLANAIGDSLLQFRLGTGAPPPPPRTAEGSAGVGGGAIAGIIIAVLVLLFIICLIAFARSRGKWCFAAKPSEAGAEALVSKKKEADVEAADAKGETDNLTAPVNDAENADEEHKKKEGEIVYAELVLDKDGLKTEVRPSPEKTEYAVIVGTKTDEEGAKKDQV